MSNETRHIVLCTDDPEEAYQRLREEKKKDQKSHWAMADVRQMINPPRTIYRWVVFKLLL